MSHARFPFASASAQAPRPLPILARLLAGMFVAGLLAHAAHAAPFQWYKTSTGCSNASLCEIDFPAVAANRLATVTNVSCSILIGTQTVEILTAQFNVVNAANDNVIVRDTVLSVLQGKNGLGSWFAINQETQLAVRAGFRVQARIATDAISSMSLQCKVGGDLAVIN